MCLLSVGILLLIRSEFCLSDPIRSDPIRVLPAATDNGSIRVESGKKPGVPYKSLYSLTLSLAPVGV